MHLFTSSGVRRSLCNAHPYLFAPQCCPDCITHCCILASRFSLLLSPLSAPKVTTNAISEMALSIRPEGLAMGMLARVCVVIAVKIALRMDYVSQVQMAPLGSMITVHLSGDVRVRILLGRTVPALPLPTVRVPSAISWYSLGCRKISG